MDSMANSGITALDHLFKKEQRQAFFDKVLEMHQRDRESTIDILEKLAEELANRQEVPPGGLIAMLNQTIRQYKHSIGNFRLQVEPDSGYVWIRRVTITPSRHIFGSREMMMGNRVLRFNTARYPPEKFLRIIFREENFEKAFSKNLTFKLISEFVGKPVKEGMEVGGGFYFS